MQVQSKLFIKGMVCQRCMLVISQELKTLGLFPLKVELGKVTVITTGKELDTALISKKLAALGYSLLEDQKVKTVREVKQLIAEVFSGRYDFEEGFRFSYLLRKRMATEYEAVSILFSLLEHKSLERYIIDFRIEKVKEFLIYTSCTLSEIAYKLNFSSVPHLSAQFRKNTGITPSHFKEMNKPRLQSRTKQSSGTTTMQAFQ